MLTATLAVAAHVALLAAPAAPVSFLKHAAPVSARKPKPNILLFFPDELRYDWGGLVNNPYFSLGELPLKTPNLDALAKRGVRFTRAIVPVPVCAPSRACLASGREYDHAGQPANGASSAKDNDFNVAKIPTFMQALQRAGYWTAVTGRDDLTKRSGPGLDGAYHTAELGFNDSARCAGSVDVTWGQCSGADGGAAPCAGIYSNESRQHATVHEPYGAYLAEQPVADVSIREKYNVSNYFELDFARYAELSKRGPYDSVHYYAIPDTLPFEQEKYQDDWIGRQAVALIQRAPKNTPWFLEVSHQAPHPPMDITPAMQATMKGRDAGWPAAYACADNAPSSVNWTQTLCNNKTVQRLRHNYASKIERLDVLLGTYLAAIAARSSGSGEGEGEGEGEDEDEDELANTVICLTSDHGEMLADRSTTAKSKPWASAMSVPLVCAGPTLAIGAVVDAPVATMDLAATFIELGGGIIDQLMNSTSLLPLLRQPTLEPPPRTVVHSGLANFRAVIERSNVTHHLKLVCCVYGKGCPGAIAADRAEMKRRNSSLEVHLFNLQGRAYERASPPSRPVALRFEPPSADLAVGGAHEADVRRLAALLPLKFQKLCPINEWLAPTPGWCPCGAAHCPRCVAPVKADDRAASKPPWSI